MERNIQRNGLVNLLALLVVGAAGYGVARYANVLSGQVASVFLGLGVLVAFVSWFQMRLEQSERLEKLEIDELARSKSSAALFESKDSEIFPAQRARRQFERFFVPGFTVLLLILQIAGAVLLWRWLATLPFIPLLKEDLVAMALFALFFLVLFLLGRFAATITRLEDHRLLRAGASYLLLGSYLCLLTAAAVGLVIAKFPLVDYYVARGLCVLLALAAVETLIGLILEIYRPRLKGKVGRPLYDSRLVGLLAQPEGVFATAAHTLDYQFGFKVSETWFYQFLKRAIAWLILLQLGALLLSTCVVFIESGEQALLERFGKPVGDTVLGPGAHLKLPWPVDKVYRFRTEQIQTLNIGFTPDDREHEEKIVLWTVAHTKEENFLVASREPARNETTTTAGGRKAPPVSLITVSMPVQYQINDLVQWVYNHEDSSNLLQQIASREVVRYLASVDFNEIMSHTRLESSLALRDHIQAAADANHLGAKILFVGLEDIHPPVTVAPEYEKVVAASHQRKAKILVAQGDSIRTNTLAAARAFTLTNAAEAQRINLELTALARAAAFTNQIPAFNAAPSVYLQRAYLQSFAAVTSKARKYVLLVTNTSNVISYDLQQRLDDDYFNTLSGAVGTKKN